MACCQRWIPFFLSALRPLAGKVGAGLCSQKSVWQPLAASQTLCLPHPKVGKMRSPAARLPAARNSLTKPLKKPCLGRALLKLS